LIPRSADSFKCIVDFLMYEKFPEIRDPFLVHKIIVDADFYLLNSVKDAANILMNEVLKENEMKKNVNLIQHQNWNGCYISVYTSSAYNNVSYVTWNGKNALSSDDHFTITNGNTINILNTGVYQISIKLTKIEFGANYYFDVYKNGGGPLMRIYSSIYGAEYYNATGSTEIHSLNANDRIQVYIANSCDEGNQVGQYHTNLSIHRIG